MMMPSMDGTVNNGVNDGVNDGWYLQQWIVPSTKDGAVNNAVNDANGAVNNGWCHQ